MERNQQVYENLFSKNPDAIYALNLNGKFTSANKSSAKLAETSLEQLIELTFLPLILDEDRQRVLDNFGKAVEGEVRTYITKFISTKGSKRHLSVTNFPIYEDNKIVGVYGIAKDITKQIIAEQKLEKERNILRSIIDNIPDYIFVKDLESRTILANKKFRKKILGTSSIEKALGQHPLDYFEAPKGKRILDPNDRVMKTGVKVINRPDTIITKNNKVENVLLTKVPLKNEKNKNVICLVGIARDITEIHSNNKKQNLIFAIIKAFGNKPSIQEAMLKTLKLLMAQLKIFGALL